MGKNIIVAEKHSVGEDYARVLGVTDTQNKGYKESDKWIVTWAQGHLVEMLYPEKYDPSLKEWKLETLPFLPDKFKYGVIDSVRFQFSVIKKLYSRSDIDCIYYAGDSGREGLYIQMLIRQFAGHKAGVNEKVVWINSQTDEEILRGINDAKDVSEYESQSDSGYMRAISDYLVGINYSRLLSILYANMVNTGTGQKKFKPISVGRVMTCVLGLVVEKERAIRTFRPRDFYRVVGNIDVGGSKVSLGWICKDGSTYFDSPKLYSEFGFNKESDAKEFIGGLENKCTISDVARTTEKKYAPLLFNLTELQNECTKKFHFTSSKTLEIAQKLYLSKMISYPRTNSRYLTQAVAGEVLGNVEKLKSGKYKDIAENILNHGYKLGKKYIDDTKVEDHYALIPTGIYKGGLTQEEEQVYEVIVRRFLAVFYPAAEYEKVSITSNVQNEHFSGTSKYLSYNGFYDVLGVPDEDENSKALVDAMAIFTSGNTYEMNYSIKKGETQSPKRFTSGSLVLAMENAGSLIEDDELREQIKQNGIGTIATRAEIIDKLISLNYLSINEKTDILNSTNLGEMVYEIISMAIPDLLYAENTASWERKLDAIAVKSLDKDKYLGELYEEISSVCKKLIENPNKDEIFKKIRPYASGRIQDEIKSFESWNTKLICPICGDEIETMSWGFKCKSNISKNEGCSFSIGDILGHRLLTNELSLLLNKGKAGPFFDFVSQKGKPFAASLVWDDLKKGINIELADMPWNKTDYKCPVCGGAVVQRDSFYKCERYIDRDNGCSFFVGKIAGKSLSPKNLESLIKTGRTELINGFKNRDGNKFDAFLCWDKEKKSIVFQFPNNSDLETDMRCPICGCKILSTSKGFRCENYKPAINRGENDCSFFAGEFMGHKIKAAELKTIVGGGTTDLVSMKNKDKKQFEARIYFDKEEKRLALKFDENKDVSLNLKCPICGGDVLKNKYGYHCSNNKGKDEGCKFYIGSISSVMIDESQLRKLLTIGKTDLIDGFKPKEKVKKPYSAYLVWDDGEKRVKFEFPDDAGVGKSSDYTCPSCRRKKLLETQYGYYCDCGFKFNKVFASKEIPKDQILKLCTVGKTDVIPGFFSAKKRKMYAAKLYVADGKLQMEIPKSKEIVLGTGGVKNEG